MSSFPFWLLRVYPGSIVPIPCLSLTVHVLLRALELRLSPQVRYLVVIYDYIATILLLPCDLIL